MEFSGRIFRTAAIAIFACLFLFLLPGSALAGDETAPQAAPALDAGSLPLPADPSATVPDSSLDTNAWVEGESDPDALPNPVEGADSSVPEESVAEPEAEAGKDIGGASSVTLSVPSAPGIDMNPGLPTGPRMSTEGALQSGAFSYSYPIAVPPGRQEVQPAVTLTYNSGAGNSWLGIGWNLDMGSISRATKRGIVYSGDDYVFCRNGHSQELVNRPEWDGTWFGDDYYGAKIEQDFAKFFKNDATGGWEVTEKDGTKYYFGSTTTSRMTNANGIFSWLVDKVQDTNGNYMTLTYFADTTNGQIYLSRIDYTYNTAPLQAKNYVEFILETRTDAMNTFETYATTKTAYRLKTIKTWTNGSLVRKYELAYEQNAQTTQSRLLSIQEYGSDGTSTLPATTFDYREGGTSWTAGTALPDFGATNFTNTNTYPMFQGDFNGDGRTDLGRVTAYTVEFYVATASGGWEAIDYILNFSPYQGFLNNQTKPMVIGDFNGDGLTDVGRVDRLAIKFYLANGDGTWSRGADLPDFGSFYYPDANINPMVIGDFNGDGRTDVGRAIEYGVAFYVATSQGGWTSISSITTFGSSQGYNSVNKYPFAIGDFNNDGRTDVGRVCAYYMYFFKATPTGGWTPISAIMSFSPSSGYSNANTCPLLVCDINGDGRTDIGRVKPTTITTGFYAASSDGGWSAVSDLPDFGRVDYDYAENFPMIETDINGDGRTDIGRVSNTGVEIWGMKADGGWLNVTGLSTFGKTQGYPLNSTHPIFEGDFNGDGKGDLCRVANTQVDVQLSTSPVPDLMNYVNNGYHGTINVVYSPVSHQTMPFILQAVTSSTLNDGLGHTSLTSYEYFNGYYAAEKREFRGFEMINRTNPDSSVAQTTYEVQDDYLKGHPLETVLFSPGGFGAEHRLARTGYSWNAEEIIPGECSLLKLSTKTSEEFYDGTTVFSQKDFTYDNDNGNLLTSTTSGSDAESVTTAMQYENAASNGWVWRMTGKKVEGSDSGKVRESWSTYQAGTGNLLSQESWLDTGNNPVVQFAYDAYGNVTAQTDARGNTTYTDYDSVDYIFPIRVTAPPVNGVAHVTQYQHNTLFGSLDWVTDQNNQTTQYNYDVFGRPIQVDYPDGGQVTTEYHDTSFPSYVKTSTKENATSTIQAYKYLDGFGRDIQDLGFGEYGVSVVTTHSYDEMGRNNRQDGPFFATGVGYPMTPPAQHPWKQTTFDDLGRPLSVTAPDSQYGTATTTLNYLGFSTTVTDPDGDARTRVKDYLGRLIRVVEHADAGDQVTSYKYNAAGDLLGSTDALGNVTVHQYDSLGRNTSTTDPDMGTWTYNYDAIGNLISQRDAKGQTVTMAYDALNRVTSKTFSTSDPSTHYIYDNLATGNGIGRLYRTANGNVTSTLNGYDAMGRSLSVTKTVTGDPNPYNTQFAYDLSGKLTRLTFPDGFYVDYAYLPVAGLLSTATGSDGQVYARCMDYDPFGRAGRMEHGNGTLTDSTFDPLSGRLTSLVTEDSTHLPQNYLQMRAYGYSPAGDVLMIQDSIKGINYFYSYDRLHRLTAESSGGAYSPIGLQYNAVGNITQKTVGSDTYTYAASPAHPHAVGVATKNGAPYNYAYDANGNMTSGPDFTNPSTTASRAIYYNALNMPTSVWRTSGGQGAVTTYLYDGDGVRVKKSVTEGATTIYLGSHFEVVNGVARRHIFAGGLRVATVDGATRTYFHKDHLGSSVAMSNAAGLSISTADYEPFGLTRGLSGALPSSYRFTDQEEDSEAGLYNFQARCYDPAIGMFITPDSVIPDYGNPQSLNRYAYCLNNPLIYVDPTGNVVWDTNGNMSSFSNDAASTLYSLVDDAKFSFLNGDYGTAALEGMAYLVGCATLIPSTLAADAIFTSSYNAGVDSMAGYMHGDWGKAGYGNIQLLTLGFLGTLSKPLSATNTFVDGSWEVGIAGRGPIAAEAGAKGAPTVQEGSFSIIDWVGHPTNLPKPAGPFRLLDGAEYDMARAAANQANRAMHQADSALRGFQIHEIQPVKFGGSPIDPLNKISLTPQQHAQATAWWNQLQRVLGGRRP